MLKIKHIMILAVLFGVMLWSTSNTVSLFANTHSLYNESAPCIKCHEDIQLQLEDTGRVTALHRTQDENYGCVSCHANPNNTMNRTAFGDYHSAYSPYCIECHNNASSIYGTQESHTKIVTEANTSRLKLDINEACAMCHTTLLDSVTVRNRVVFAFEADSIAFNGSAEYDGTYTTTFSDTEPKGLHNYNSGVQCIMCHAPVQELLRQNRVPYSNHIVLGCKDCHRNTSTGTEEFHAAKIIYCSDCHDLSTHQPSFSRDCNQCHESHGGLKETEPNSHPVASITLNSGGSGYTFAPAVSITGGGGTGAVATATLAPRSVASITVTDGGSDYKAIPYVTISGGGGTGATATAIVVQRRVTGITVTNGGTGYTSDPTVSITPVKDGSGATATATLAPAAVASLTLMNGGSGYISAPTVSFTGGGGIGANATATLEIPGQS